MGSEPADPRRSRPSTRRQKGERPRWAPDLVALAAIGFLTLVSQISLIWHHAVPDLDTDTFILRAAKPCGGTWIAKGMGDSAHPLGNALIQRWDCHFQPPGGLTPASGWFLLLSLAVVLVVALVVGFAFLRGGGAGSATVAVAYLGLSPAMRTMATRADEKWIGVMLFLVTTLCILGFHRSAARRGAWLLAVILSSTVLGLWHTQYVLILLIGLVPWGVVALLRPAALGTTRLRAVALGSAVFVLPGALIGLLLRTGYVVKVPYEKLFYSIFNDKYWHGWVTWFRDYVAYSSRWLTGWLSNDGTQEIQLPAPAGTSFVLLGLVALALYLLVMVMTRDWLLCAVAFGCLALPFLYEPNNAERWDAVSIVFALASGVARSRHARGVTTDAPAEGPSELESEAAAAGAGAGPSRT
jgi:hypothetical protein